MSALLEIILLCWIGGLGGDPFAARVIQVNDGDTITVLSEGRQIKVRMASIDCPEWGMPFGRNAARFTSNKVLGKTITIVPKAIDRYGRIVARVLFGSSDLSEELVEAGLAWHYARFDNDPVLARAEMNARVKSLGIWSLRHPIPPWTYRETREKEGKKLIREGFQPDLYHGNLKSKVFHRSACPHFNCKNCQEIFYSRNMAIQSGFKPCGICNP
jgi:endonuclease YncB( thermonuclease family)